MYDASLILEDKKLLQNERKVRDKLLADIQHDIVQKFTTELVNNYDQIVIEPSLSLSLPSRQDMGILVLTAANKIRKEKAILFLIMWKNISYFYIILYFI
mgnify:CR=1 FL=1